MASAAGIRAGAAYVELALNDSKFVRGLRGAMTRLKAFGGAIRSLGGWVTGIGTQLSLAGAAITAPLLASVKSFTSLGDQLEKMSKRTSVSVEALSELGYAAQLSGASLTDVETAIKFMQRSLAEAAQGTKSNVETFERLNVNLRQLQGLSPEAQFMVLGKRLAEIKNPAQRAALAMELFGRSGTNLLPMLGDMATLRAEARRLGLTMSTDAASAAAELNDAMDRLWITLRMAGVAIGSALAPQVLKWVKTVRDAIAQGTRWITQNKGLVVSLLKIGLIAVGTGAALLALGTVISTLGSAIAGIGTILGGVVTMISGIGAAVGLVSSVLAVLVGAAGGVANSLLYVGTAFRALSAVGTAAAGGIGQSFIVLGALITGIGPAARTIGTALTGALRGVQAMAAGAIAAVRAVPAALAGIWAAVGGFTGIAAAAWAVQGFSLIVAGALSASQAVVRFLAVMSSGPAIISVVTSAFGAIKTAALGLVSVFSGGIAAIGAAFAALKAAFLSGGLMGALSAVTTAVGGAFVSLGTAIAGLGAPITLIIAALGALAAYAVYASGLFGRVWSYATGQVGAAMDWLGRKFDELKSWALRSFQGIQDALMAGDIALAGKVLWLSLQVAWKAGTNALQNVWLDFKNWFASNATDLLYGAAAAVASAWSTMKKIWVEGINFWIDTFNAFTASFRTLWNEIVGWAAKKWTELMGSLPEAVQKLALGDVIDVSAATKRIDEETARGNQATQMDRVNAIAAQDRDSVAIDEDRRRTMAALANMADAEGRTRRASYDAERAAGEEALAEAKAKLIVAIEEARTKRESLESRKSEKSFEIPDVGGAVAQVAKLDAMGTFSGLAVGQLGVGSTATERIAKASEETARETKRVRQLMETDSGGFQ